MTKTESDKDCGLTRYAEIGDGYAGLCEDAAGEWVRFEDAAKALSETRRTALEDAAQIVAAMNTTDVALFARGTGNAVVLFQQLAKQRLLEASLEAPK